MGKKFEEAQLTPKNIVDGYMLLGLGNLLGDPGAHTALEFGHPLLEEEMKVYCLPGSLNKDDIQQLLRDAGLLAA